MGLTSSRPRYFYQKNSIDGCVLFQQVTFDDQRTNGRAPKKNGPPGVPCGGANLQIATGQHQK